MSRHTHNPRKPSRIRADLTVLIALFALAPLARAQWMGKQTGCYADSIAATPNRPTVANTSNVTQYGVLELEYGWDRIWPQTGVRQTSSGGMLKLGMLCDVELHWITTSFVSLMHPGGVTRTMGDNWFGPKVRFYRQVHGVPTMSVAYAVKVPSASTEQGIGSGHVDHTFTFGVSEDIKNLTMDFNATELLAGRSSPGVDQNQQYALASSFPLWRQLQMSVEMYGDTSLDRDTPGFVSSLGALTYAVRPRLVLDGGYEAGITAGGPHRHAFFGFTYSIANVYKALRRR